MQTERTPEAESFQVARGVDQPAFRALTPLLLLVAASCGTDKRAPSEEARSRAAATPTETPSDTVAELAAPAAAAPLEPRIEGREVAYEAGGAPLKGYLAYDANRSGKRPGVLIVHEWWGLNDYVRSRARQLAAMGYTALAVDIYGDGKQTAHADDAKKFMLEALSHMDEAEARFRAGRAFLRDQEMTDPSKMAAIGYCFGGGLALHMARIGEDLAGVASFHGSLATETPAAQGAIKARLLVATGADDPFVPAEQVEAFRKEMADAGAMLKLLSYEGAKHAFTNPGATALGEQFSLPLAYNESADKESWAELDQFLRDIFVANGETPVAAAP